MSANYNVATRNSRLQAVVTAIDAGGGNGVLRLLSAAGSILSSLALARPCGAASAGILAFSGLSLIDPAAAATGTATAARVEDSAGTVVISGLTVGTPPNVGVDIVLTPSNDITAGQTIAITAATIAGN